MLLADKTPEGLVARYEPFEVNNQAQLQQAFADFQSGRMVEIARYAKLGQPREKDA